ncbi:MAG: hypothetical protein ACI4V5_00275 [Prevotella sp.]
MKNRYESFTLDISSDFDYQNTGGNRISASGTAIDSYFMWLTEISAGSG